MINDDWKTYQLAHLGDQWRLNWETYQLAHLKDQWRLNWETYQLAHLGDQWRLNWETYQLAHLGDQWRLEDISASTSRRSMTTGLRDISASTSRWSMTTGRHIANIRYVVHLNIYTTSSVINPLMHCPPSSPLHQKNTKSCNYHYAVCQLSCVLYMHKPANRMSR